MAKQSTRKSRNWKKLQKSERKMRNACQFLPRWEVYLLVIQNLVLSFFYIRFLSSESNHIFVQFQMKIDLNSWNWMLFASNQKWFKGISSRFLSLEKRKIAICFSISYKICIIKEIRSNKKLTCNKWNFGVEVQKSFGWHLWNVDDRSSVKQLKLKRFVSFCCHS